MRCTRDFLSEKIGDISTDQGFSEKAVTLIARLIAPETSISENHRWELFDAIFTPKQLITERLQDVRAALSHDLRLSSFSIDTLCILSNLGLLTYSSKARENREQIKERMNSPSKLRFLSEAMRILFASDDDIFPKTYLAEKLFDAFVARQDDGSAIYWAIQVLAETLLIHDDEELALRYFDKLLAIRSDEKDTAYDIFEYFVSYRDLFSGPVKAKIIDVVLTYGWLYAHRNCMTLTVYNLINTGLCIKNVLNNEVPYNNIFHALSSNKGKNFYLICDALGILSQAGLLADTSQAEIYFNALIRENGKNALWIEISLQYLSRHGFLSDKSLANQHITNIIRHPERMATKLMELNDEQEKIASFLKAPNVSDEQENQPTAPKKKKTIGKKISELFLPAKDKTNNSKNPTPIGAKL
jgi:hypothetical protein